MSDEPEDFDLLAGEYVLGVFDAAETAAVEALAGRDDAVALAIEAWQNRLAPLSLAAVPVPPPATLWPRIGSTIGGFTEQGAPSPAATATPPRGAEVVRLRRGAWNNLALWRTTTAAALALAAAFAAIAFLQRPGPPPELAAALAQPNAPAPGFLAEVQPDGSILLRPLTHLAVEAGRDLELWALPQGATRPVSLGVLPPIGRHVPPSDLVRPSTQLMISLEPQGGSRTGEPTGPVLYAGTLTPVD